MDFAKMMTEVLAAGLTQQAVAKAVGRSQGWVSKVKTGALPEMLFSDAMRLKRLHRKHVKKVAGISFHTFLCPVCKVSRHVRGRVARGNGKGFRCSVCEEKRIERRKANEQGERPPR